MSKNKSSSDQPISDALRKAISESGKSFREIERETGIVRQSLMRFVRGETSLRLDIADKLAKYFNLKLRK